MDLSFAMKKMRLDCEGCEGLGYVVKECRVKEENRQNTDEEDNLRRKICAPGDEISNGDLYKSDIGDRIDLSKYEGIPVKVTGCNAPKNITSFQTECLCPNLVENMRKVGYVVPTPVQKYAIPIISAGRDLMACAAPRSGKTGAFLLPILHNLIESQAVVGGGAGASTAKPQCVVITPTLELAIQIHHEALKFCHGSMIKSVVAYGETSVKDQAQQILKGCNILIATPGRLIEHLEKKRVSFSNLKFLVLDEAERLLDTDLIHEIQDCVDHPSMPPVGIRNTLMFSDLFSNEIQTVAQEFLNDYLFLTVGKVIGDRCSGVVQEFYKVAQFDKRQKLLSLLRDPGRNPTDRILVFVQTKWHADFLATFLSSEGILTSCIHGVKVNLEREGALLEYRSGTLPILVATAVAARGLDMPRAQHVVNYDLPTKMDEYFRVLDWTERVGNTRKATSFYDDENDANIASPLVEMLTENNIPVPDWLAESAAVVRDVDGWD